MDRRLNIKDLQQMIDEGRKLTAVAVWDYTQARLADQAGVDILLVDEALAGPALGLSTSLGLTVDQIVYHTAAAARGSRRALLVAGLPFGCYQQGENAAVGAAVRLLKEGGCGAVAVAGGRELSPLVNRLTKDGVPVLPHIGLAPQTAALWDSEPVRGMDESAAWELVDTAQQLEEAGAPLLLMDCVTSEAAALISTKVDVPTIGVGCGSGTNGQLLAFGDLLGLNEESPHFAQSFARGGDFLRQGLQAFAAAVRDGSFPQPEHATPMEDDEAKKLY